MSFHVRGVGWVYTGADLLPRVHRPDPERVYLDPDEDRARVAERLRVRRAAENPPHEPWPEPEVPMRVVAPGSAPGAVGSLLSRLVGAGWRAVVTYSRGTLFDAQRRPGRVVGCYAVRAARGQRRAVAVWWQAADGRLSSQKVLTWGDRPARWVGIKEFEGGM